MESLANLLEHTSTEPFPKEAISSLLQETKSEIEADCFCLYLLNPSKSIYVTLKTCQCPNLNENKFFDIVTDDSDSELSYLQRATLSRKPIILQITDAIKNPNCNKANILSRLIVPINQERQCIGVIDFGSKERNHFSITHEHFARSIAATISLLIEKERTLNYLNAIQHPISYHQSETSFLHDILLLIATATELPYIVIRELQEDALISIAQLGFDEEENKDLDFLDYKKYPPFSRALEEKRTLVYNTMDDPDLETLKNHEAVNSKIKSFVVTPILIGDVEDGTDEHKIFGTLSYAYPMEYNFSLLEIARLESIANAIGVSITNYRNYQQQADDLFEVVRHSALLHAADIAQSARHEIKIYLDTVSTTAGNIFLLAGKGGQSNLKIIQEKAKTISDNLILIHNSLLKIKEITKHPEREKTSVNVKEVWNEAFGMLIGRLNHEKIDHIIDTSGFKMEETKVNANKDSLTHAFFLLIQNSVEAFRNNFEGQKSKKTKRRIDVRILPPSESDNELVTTYTDNATGIDPSKLIIEEKDTDTPMEEVIFLPGVTSKKEGSGYGLYLVRKIVSEHKGSINLISHRGGVQFRISLPIQK